MSEHSFINELLWVLGTCLVGGVFSKFCKLPILVGYLISGAVVGQGGLGLLGTQYHEIEYLAEMGALLLLFSIGLEFSLEELSRMKNHILTGGSTQMLLTAVPATFLGTMFGLSWQAAMLLGLAISLSSTVLVFKALQETQQSSTSFGRHTLSILLFQDIAIIPILLIVPFLTGSQENIDMNAQMKMIVISLLMFIILPVLRRSLQKWIIPFLSKQKSSELNVLFVTFVLGTMTWTAHYVGMPSPIGAFAAGLVLNGNRLTGQIDALIMPFREACAAIFFVSIGMLFRPAIIFDNPLLILGLFAGILVLKCLAAAIATGFTGLDKWSALGVGITLSQIGEFSFLLGFASLEAKVITQLEYDYLMIFALSSLFLTPTLMRFGVKFFKNPKPVTQDRDLTPKNITLDKSTPSMIVVGVGEVGFRISTYLETIGAYVTAIDLSSVNLHPLAQIGISTITGDARFPSTYTHAEIPAPDVTLVCVADDRFAIEIIKVIYKSWPECKIIARCRSVDNIHAFKKAGAEIIIEENTEVIKAIIPLFGKS